MLEVSNESVAESATDYRHFKQASGVTSHHADNISKCCRVSSSYRDPVYQPPTSGSHPPVKASRRQHVPMPRSPQGMSPSHQYFKIPSEAVQHQKRGNWSLGLGLLAGSPLRHSTAAFDCWSEPSHEGVMLLYALLEGRHCNAVMLSHSVRI